MSAQIIPFPQPKSAPDLGSDADTVLILAGLLVDLKRASTLDEGIAIILGRERA